MTQFDHEYDLLKQMYESEGHRGEYDPSRLTVRMKKELFDVLISVNSGFAAIGTRSTSIVDAFSTFLHETIHWWQHIGTTTGLVLTMTGPAESHINLASLKDILEKAGPKKSLRRLRILPGHASVREPLNSVLNNFFDGEFNKRLVLDDKEAAKIIATHHSFLSAGHSMQIAISNTLRVLSNTFDDCRGLLPDLQKWESEYDCIGTVGNRDFTQNGDILVAPVSGREILEGQARFSQIQYLYLASGGRLKWSDFEKMGMLEGEYVSAFTFFLRAADCERPGTPTDSIVQLFLLVCDLALNPGDGYPFTPSNYSQLVTSCNPGRRFDAICREVSQNKSLCSRIEKCSRTVYESVAAEICQKLDWRSPIEIASTISKWADSECFLKLLEEDNEYSYSDANLPIRLCYAKHLRFAQDKAMHPEFFCWPAMSFVENSMTEFDAGKTVRLWGSHCPMFVASIGGDIRPTIPDWVTEAKVMDVFERFYTWNAHYSIIRQWISADGAFNFDFRILSQQYSLHEYRSWVSSIFKSVFDTRLEDFKIL